MHREYFPEAFIQLQLEMSHHPLLIQRIQKHANLGVEVILAEVAHYCGYAVDNTFDGEQLEVLADILLTKLRRMSVQSAIQGLSDNWKKESWKFGI